MNYYSNIQLSKKFNISPIQITRWIEKSRLGKNNLQIKQVKQKTSDKEVFKIIVNENNDIELERLFEHGKVKRRYFGKVVKEIEHNSLGIFSTKQKHELIKALKQNYIPFKLAYISKGANEWNEFVNTGLLSKEYTPVIDTIDQLNELYNQIIKLVPKDKKVNIIDIGCGNYLPVVDFVNKIKKGNYLNKYIGIDISSDLLDIVKFEAGKYLKDDEIITSIGDFENENFLDVVGSNSGDNIINIMLFLGSTIGNHTDYTMVLKHLRDSMNEDDILIISNKLYDKSFKVDFKHSVDRPEQLLWIPELLGFNIENCELFVEFNEKLDSKALNIVADSDYQLIFKKEDKVISEIFINKGEKILLWHHRMTQLIPFVTDLNNAGLNLMSFNCSRYNRGMFITQAKKFKDMI